MPIDNQMEKEMAEELIPIIMFIMIGLVFLVMFHFKFKSKAEFQQTIRLALEKGTELTPDLISRLGEPEPNKDRDLRRGLVWLALAAGTAALAFGIPDEDTLGILLSVAAFPFFIGLAFVIMWRYGLGQKEKS